MSNNGALYIRLFEKLCEFHSDEHLRRIKNWAWIVVGVLQSHSVHLSEIAQHIPSEAEAPGRITQVRRWLSNKFVKVAEFYRPLISQAIQDWAGKDVFLILDSGSVNHEALQFFRLSLSYCYRALPLVWMVVASAGLIQVEACAVIRRGILCQTLSPTVRHRLSATVGQALSPTVRHPWSPKLCHLIC